MTEVSLFSEGHVGSFVIAAGIWSWLEWKSKKGPHLSPHSVTTPGGTISSAPGSSAAGGSAATTPPSTAGSATASPPTPPKKPWYKTRAGIGAIIVGAMLAIALLAVSFMIESPSLGAATRAIQSRWVQIILATIAITFLVALTVWGKKGLGGALWTVVGVAFVLFALLPLANAIWGEQSPMQASQVKKVLASADRSSWPVAFILEGEQKSMFIPLFPGMHHVVASGDGFRLQNVYRDGSKCMFGSGCPKEADLTGVYFVRETPGKMIAVRYAFEPIAP